MTQDFLRGPLGKIGSRVCRIGLSATYRPGRETVFKALDEGLNYFLFFGFDNHMTSVLRETVPARRDQYVLATGAYNYIWRHQNLRRTLDKRLRQIRTDYIDVFHFLGVTRRAHFTPQVREELQAVRESGLVRAVSISTHDRKFAVELAREGVLDGMMIPYNAAPRKGGGGDFSASAGVKPGRSRLHGNALDPAAPAAARISEWGARPYRRYVLPLRAFQSRGPCLFDGAGQFETI